MSMTIANYLEISDKSVVGVIGCGGKTSFVELVAQRLSSKKVLVSTTTKMFPLKDQRVMQCQTLQQCLEHQGQPGIQNFGILNTESGKLEALPHNILHQLIEDYDIVLLEADGSRGLPCKGWLQDEPAVPEYCTHTVGILTMKALGSAATETTVLRLPEFLQLTGLGEGDTITTQALETMVCAPLGMFKNSVGRCSLIVNQVEDEETAGIAQGFLRAIKGRYPGRFERLLYGSTHLDVWEVG